MNLRDLLGGGWIGSIAVLIGLPLLALILHTLLVAVGGRLARRTRNRIDEAFVRHARGPTRAIFPLLGLLAALPGAGIPAAAEVWLGHAVGIGLIASTGWLLVGLISVMDDVIQSRYPVEVKDNLAARKVMTQMDVFRRVAIVLITIVSVGVILMTFPEIRHIGDSLLASAGLAGLVVGIAARPALSNLIAGIQLALTEPIRIDDVVIVEGEWGWVEEICTTYVVVRIWDLRRLVVPLSYFIEKPFQNWTRTSADLLGTVFVYADYRVPVQEIRDELEAILRSSGMWDGKVSGVQVTDATEHTLEVRLLMSAPDSSTAWDLRCLVRERMVEFLQRRHPECLPRARVELKPGPGGPGAPAPAPAAHAA
jgi:small-conductance mechanosensitive channel